MKPDPDWADAMTDLLNGVTEPLAKRLQSDMAASVLTRNLAAHVVSSFEEVRKSKRILEEDEAALTQKCVELTRSMKRDDARRRSR